MIRASVAAARKQTFLMCRYALILSTGALVFREIAADASLVLAALLVCTALASNVVMSRVPPLSFFDAGFQAPLLLADTAMISMAFLLTHAGPELFIFFFVLLIVVAKVENMMLIGICAALIGVASIVFPSDAPTLMRVPFMFAVGIFFGYVVLPERTGEMIRIGDRRASQSLQYGAQPTDPVLLHENADDTVRPRAVRAPQQKLSEG
jgi:hypothetical protein